MAEHPLIAQLENRGVLNTDGAAIDVIASMSLSEIIDCGQEAALLTSAELMPRERTVFVHSAAGSLGAGRTPCGGLPCRSARARELAEFATVYSDRVYVSNFLSQHQAIEAPRATLDRVREEFYNDVVLIAELRPLIEAGRIAPVTFPAVHCPQCLVHDTLGQEADRRLSIALRGLERRIRTEVMTEIEKRAGRYTLRLTGPDDLLEHGETGLSTRDVPNGLDQFPRILARVERGENVAVSSRVLTALKLHHVLVRSLLDDIAFDVMSTQALGTSFVTERRLHTDMLQAMSRDPEQERRNQIVERHLSTIIPFLADVETADLIRLRQREEEAFILFRHRLNEAIRETLARRGQFEEKEARDLYGDVLAPGLAKLDQQVRAAKQASRSSLRRKGVASVGVLSFGTYSGLLPSGLMAAAKAFGLTRIANDLGEEALKGSKGDELIRREDLFFLWKVRERRAGDLTGFDVPAV